MELEEALDDVFSERLRPIPDLRELPPAERAAVLPLDIRRELAREIARQEGIQIRSAMRRLQRYVTEALEIRRPSRAILDRMARRRATLPFRRRGIRGRLTAAFLVSKDCRSRMIRFTIPAADVGPILDAWEVEEYERMADAFRAAFAANYLEGIEIGCPDVEEEVEHLEIEGREVAA